MVELHVGMLGPVLLLSDAGVWLSVQFTALAEGDVAYSCSACGETCPTLRALVLSCGCATSRGLCRLLTGQSFIVSLRSSSMWCLRLWCELPSRSC